MQVEVDKHVAIPLSPTGNLNLSFEEKIEVDNKSVYIGNVDYCATAEELEQHFRGCGSINRVAYVEFSEKKKKTQMKYHHFVKKQHLFKTLKTSPQTKSGPYPWP